MSAPPSPTAPPPVPTPTPPADRPAMDRRAASDGQPEPLRKIAEVELAKEKMDLARNGNSYHLVRTECPDAYGRPVARKVPLGEFLRTPGGGLREDRAQALVLIGELLTQVQGQKDLRLAAERGAEP